MIVATWSESEETKQDATQIATHRQCRIRRKRYRVTSSNGESCPTYLSSNIRTRKGEMQGCREIEWSVVVHSGNSYKLQAPTSVKSHTAVNLAGKGRADVATSWGASGTARGGGGDQKQRSRLDGKVVDVHGTIPHGSGDNAGRHKG